MKILSVECSATPASCAIINDGKIVASSFINTKLTHSQTLMQMIINTLDNSATKLCDIDKIAIAVGPGSFTGLRIGAATAKGLGLALNKPLVEVPTLEGLAYNLWGTTSLVCPLMDARRNQVYTGIYEFVREGHTMMLRSVREQCAVDITEMITALNELGRDVIFLGDGVPVYSKVIEEQMQVPFSYAPAGNNRQKASSVAALGAVYYSQGKTVTAAEHQPEYLRKSQAEREQEGK